MFDEVQAMAIFGAINDIRQVYHKGCRTLTITSRLVFTPLHFCSTHIGQALVRKLYSKKQNQRTVYEQVGNNF